MKKPCEQICTSEQLDILTSFCIQKRAIKTKAKHHKFLTKMIKRARILGLLPFSHMNFVA